MILVEKLFCLQTFTLGKYIKSNLYYICHSVELIMINALMI